MPLRKIKILFSWFISVLLVLLTANSVFSSSLAESSVIDPVPQSSPTPSLSIPILINPQFTLPDNLGGTLGGFLNQVNKVEDLYNQAYAKYQNQNYLDALVDLEDVIEELVDPEYSVWSDIEESDLETLIENIGEGIIRATQKVVAPLIASMSELFFGEEGSMDFEDPEARQQLEAGIERAHTTAAKSLRLLQKTLIAESEQDSFLTYQAENAVKALKVAELGRQLEFVRLQPILTRSNLPSKAIIPEKLTSREIQRITKEQNATIVYYSVVAPEEIFIWVIQPTGKIEFRKSQIEASDTSLEESIDYALKVASQFVRGREDKSRIQAIRDLRATDINEQLLVEEFTVNETEQRDKLQRLYQILIAPIQNFLPTDPNAHVVFIPQDKLFSVPFAALQDTSGQYLVEQHTVRLAPSLRSLRYTKSLLKKFPRSEDILIVGNPTMPIVQLDPSEPPQQLANLSGAEAEALELAEIFHTYAITKEQATETEVVRRMASAKIIHLATHGILDNHNPALASTDLGRTIEEAYGSQATDYLNKLIAPLLPSAVALAKSNGTDGLLTSQEFLSLNLDADLAVLSACNTARGIPGDSTVLGLPFSLGVSGTSRVVVSLWSVPDIPTKDLMVEFYRVMQKYDQQGERVDIAKALREAMLSVKQNPLYPDPVNWAAFTMIEIPQQN